MQLVDWLKNLTVRFLINLPHSELTSVSRLCFQVEEAQWYYEDFVRPLEAASGNNLPHLSLKEFCLLIFKNCPLTNCFTEEQHIAAYETFLAYKVRVPVRGAILLDESMERAVLVRGWKKGANWSFPRGKINKDEKDLTCAIREVYEETGFDIRAAGLVPQDEDQAKYIDVTMREQHMRLFVFRNVPLDTHFEPRTRKEISKIEWYNLRDLPGYSKKNKGAQHDHAQEVIQANKFYMVAPFLGPLKKWIAQQRRNEAGLLTEQAEFTQAAESDYAQVEEALQPNDGKSAELRKLLNIGGAAVPSIVTGAPLSPHNQPMLQQTPPHNLVDAQHNLGNAQVRPQQYPPHLQHTLGHASNQQLSSPQFAQQGPPRDPFIPATYSYGPPPGIQHLPHGIPAHLQGNMAFPPQHIQPSSQGILTSPGLQIVQFQTQTQGQSQGFPQRQFTQSQSIHTSHDEPSAMLAAPKASELPTPKLNAHSMRLLEAFKQGPPRAESAAAPQTKQQPNDHQTRLLDLFKSPTQTPASAAVSTPIDGQQTAGPNAAARPVALQERKTTLNEFTRTLPAKSRKSSQQSTNTPPQAQPFVAPLPKEVSAPVQQAQHAHGQITSKTHKTSEHSKKNLIHNGNAEVLQRSQNRKPASLETRQTSHTSTGSAKHVKSKNTVQEVPKTPSFTILTRPGSKESANTSPVPTPQLLKRSNDETDGANAKSDGPVPNGMKTQQQDHLLALFGGASGPATSKPQSPVPMAAADTGKPISILRHPSPLTQTSTVLPAPERSEFERTTVKPTTNSQDHLLGLFKVNGAGVNAVSPSMGGEGLSMRRSPLVRSAEKGTDAKLERKSSTSATPTEAKNFLLGFLNDVVQKEGRAS